MRWRLRWRLPSDSHRAVCRLWGQLLSGSELFLHLPLGVHLWSASSSSSTHCPHPTQPPKAKWLLMRDPLSPCLTGSCGGTQSKLYLCGTSLCAALVSAKSKLLFCYSKDIKCGEVGVPGRANVFWLRNQLSQISFHFHCDPERLSERQNPLCMSLSKPEHIILTPAHAKSFHSERNLFLPPAGGAQIF